MTQTNNEINDVLSKLTALGSVLVPMNLVTGLWGMNVQVPGQYQVNVSNESIFGRLFNRYVTGGPYLVYMYHGLDTHFLCGIYVIDEIL